MAGAYLRMAVAGLRGTGRGREIEVRVAVGVEQPRSAPGSDGEREEADLEDVREHAALALEQRLAGGERSLGEHRLERLGHGGILAPTREPGGRQAYPESMAGGSSEASG